MINGRSAFGDFAYSLIALIVGYIGTMTSVNEWLPIQLPRIPPS